MALSSSKGRPISGGITGAVQSDPGTGFSGYVQYAMHYCFLKVFSMADYMFCSRGKYSVSVEVSTHSHSLPHRAEHAADRTL